MDRAVGRNDKPSVATLLRFEPFCLVNFTSNRGCGNTVEVV